MAYGREQLRKAGNFLGDLDAKYTNQVRKVQALNNPMSGVPLNELNKYPNEGVGWKERRLVDAMTAGVAVSNVASRYALPAGGVTLAGKGLYDLTMGFQQQAEEDQQTNATLMP